jgi:large subunit ribosomal protein L16
MLLQPKKIKYTKIKKGKLLKFEYKSNTLKFGTIGLKAAESGTINARQIEAARQAIVRKIQRKGKIWIRIFPSVPITKKPIEVRMGKGKGAVNYWAAKIKKGTVLFEVCGVATLKSIPAFKTGASKLPIKTIIFS